MQPAPLNMPQCQRLANAKGLKNSERILCRKNTERLCSIKLSFSSFLRMHVLLGIFLLFSLYCPAVRQARHSAAGRGRDATRAGAGGRGECECESENSPAGPEARAGDCAAESSQGSPVCISKCENIIATAAASSLRSGVSNDANILFPLSVHLIPQYRTVPCGFPLMDDPRVTPPQPARKGEPLPRPEGLQDQARDRRQRQTTEPPRLPCR
ncbi:unnamed protein product [Nyctereutes procyonoides]|uniref:(raccoon dog) hypothetical protein n=1 Tax=Nyctereutes procyonoides TaxID=34880 RepID=A0A811YA43_NYCPR|nr:unnamed protein product [Nyctereutes procyonoides]